MSEVDNIIPLFEIRAGTTVLNNYIQNVAHYSLILDLSVP